VLGVELWLKDDGTCNSLYGGNKVRKLEFVLPEVLRSGASAVLTLGAIGSNQAVAVGAHAGALGLQVTVVQCLQPQTPHVTRNLEALKVLGVRRVLAGHQHDLPFSVPVEWLRRFLDHGRPPYFLPPGASTAEGVLGYVEAALELDGQLDPHTPWLVVVPVGSGGTLAGLALGKALFSLGWSLSGIAVTPVWASRRGRIERLATAAHALLRAKGAVSRAMPALDFELRYDQLGHGYGYPTSAALEAMALAEQVEGLVLEPTYTGKALAACIRLARSTHRPVVFWNTLSSTVPGNYFFPDVSTACQGS